MKIRGRTPGQSEHHQGERAARGDREPDHPLARGVGALRASRAELSADDDLARDRDRVEDEREEDEQLERDLVRADRGVSETRRDRACEHERGHQRGCAQEDPLPEREHPPREDEPRARVGTLHPPQDHDHERRPHPELRDRGSRGGAGDPPVEPVHEEHLEDDVHHVSGDHDDERRSQVGDPAQVALAAEREKRRGEPDRGDTEVRDGVVGGVSLPAHERDERLCEHGDEPRHRDPEREGEPDRLGAEPPCRLGLSGSARAGDLRGRPVLEEVEDREGAAEDGRGDPERGELRPSQVADDGRVDEQVERLGGERAQRGNRELEDLAVVLASAASRVRQCVFGRGDRRLVRGDVVRDHVLRARTAPRPRA